jgi:hypothetical protein
MPKLWERVRSYLRGKNGDQPTIVEAAERVEQAALNAATLKLLVLARGFDVAVGEQVVDLAGVLADGDEELRAKLLAGFQEVAGNTVPLPSASSPSLLPETREVKALPPSPLVAEPPPTPLPAPTNGSTNGTMNGTKNESTPATETEYARNEDGSIRLKKNGEPAMKRGRKPTTERA